GLPLPFWMKPVKSFASHLGFRVASEQDFRRALARTRRDIGRLATPFDDVLELADVPLDVARPGQVACLAEQIVGGRQCTIEGCVVDGEMMVFGVVDSLRAENGSTFLRYQYPSALPGHVQRRMTALCERVVRRIGFDSGCFNAELFWDEARDHVWFLEINPRIALHHVELYERVDGLSSYEMAVEVALGRRPVLARGAGELRTKYDRVVERLDIRLTPTGDREPSLARAPAVPLAAPPRSPRAGRADERLAAWRASRGESERSRDSARASARASARPSPVRSRGRRAG
ncbi:MAG: ATP-grasp domain-containing protein, partial [Polyangiales bacterium]